MVNQHPGNFRTAGTSWLGFLVLVYRRPRFSFSVRYSTGPVQRAIWCMAQGWEKFWTAGEEWDNMRQTKEDRYGSRL